MDETFISHQASKSGISFSAPNQWRYGQTVMNVLYDIWPKKYDELTGSDYDCFYDNSKIELALTKLEKEWVDHE